MSFPHQLHAASNNTYSLYSATILTHYRMFVCILLRNKPLLFPKWPQKPTRPILHYSSVVQWKSSNLQNSYEINKNNYEDNFFRSGDWEKKEIYISKKDFFGVSGTWIANI